MGPDRTDWPFWVKMGLWGIADRGTAWIYFWLSLLLVTGTAAISLMGLLPWWLFVTAVVGLFAPLWYVTAILWVDSHGGWEKRRRKRRSADRPRRSRKDDDTDDDTAD